MPEIEERPWIWLGFAEVYLSDPSQGRSSGSPGRRWQALTKQEGSDRPWGVAQALAEGARQLRRPGERLGLGQGPGPRALERMVLDALLQRLGPGPGAVLFAPPRQLAGLVELVRDLPDAPLLLSSEAALLAGEAPEPVLPERHPNYYIPDWDHPRQGIARRLPQRFSAPKAVPAPVLLDAADYAAGRFTRLGRMGPAGAQPALNIGYRAPVQTDRGHRPVGFGLVWAWGIGPLMWQWALAPLDLPPGNEWTVEVPGDGTCRIQADSGINQQHELRPPLDGFEG